jgi:hypothetical protein
MRLRRRRAVEPDPDEPDLLDWSDAKARASCTGLLIGNGASIACWERFNYRSIFEQAREGVLEHSLADEDVEVFEAFGTQNFEAVLAALKTATITLDALGYQTGFLRERYESVQDALFDAIHAVHVPWGITRNFEEKLQTIRRELEGYKWIYSLNYDLILYWAITSVGKGSGIADFFWNDAHIFDPANTVPKDYASDWPRVVWLHGGIHLRRRIDGTVFKETADEGGNLLEKFKTPADSEVTPLLVSEGTSDDKYRAITRSAYLDFALRRLSEHAGGLAILGSSLRNEDRHLVRAINEQPVANLAVSIHRDPDGGEDSIIERKGTLQTQFRNSNLYFFDSATHPLGAPSLRFE